MEAARRPRARLSRWRPPSRGGPPSGRPWFLLGSDDSADSGDSEPWAALLRMASAGLTLDCKSLPPLPTFPGQEPQPGGEDAVPSEVFTVGPKAFAWTPFPPAPGGFGSSHSLLRAAGDPLGSPTPSLKGPPVPESFGTPSSQERLSVGQGPPILQSCPMCQKEFAPKLTQLDVDSHLAQCLAESTEDVAW